MRYLTFADEENTYRICILVRQLNKLEIKTNYISPLAAMGIDPKETVAYELDSTAKNNKNRLTFLKELLEILTDLQTDYLLVCDGNCFKQLTKTTKAETSYGYVKPCVIKGYEHIKVIFVPGHTQLFYNPPLAEKINLGLSALVADTQGVYRDPGDRVIKFFEYPQTPKRIQYWLEKLIEKDCPLTVDIETFTLKHLTSGIGSIAFAWNQHEGIAFTVDFLRTPEEAKEIRRLLKAFFFNSKSKKIYHKIAFDVYILIYQLFMMDQLDTVGMYKGMDCLLDDWECTLLITYLATNNCSGNTLGLKENAQEFSGEYAKDVKDITLLSQPDLLQYNLIDALSTWYVYNKNYPRMVVDQQESVYVDLFKPMTLDIIQMQLTGLPMDMEKVKEAKIQMQAESDKAKEALLTSPIVGNLEADLAADWAYAKNQKLKKKQVTYLDYTKRFNPNSPLQVQKLLYETMELPVVDYSDNKQPSTKRSTITKLVHYTDNPLYLEVLNQLINFKNVDKILTAFIPAFEECVLAPDGWHYLFGNFNIGGTLSGRLSCSDVNLQQLPATGSMYAKPIKKCFKAPEGWLLIGLDFNSLEDVISALTTRDPNKLAVYIDGYDGHCLRAFSYFGNQMPGIVNTVQSINSIKTHYPQLRQLSKAPTFALTYQGTWVTLMANCGFSEAVAKDIEAKYHTLYEVSDKWVQERLQRASVDGYVTVAFGLRIRTPLLQQTILGNRRTPFEAEAEGRTAGNALGQSYGLLNSRAAMAFMKKVRASEHRHNIRPCAQIHDAQYYLVRDNIETVFWVNEHLVECVRWTGLPEIQHPIVKLDGELSLFYPNWASELTIPNNATRTDIKNLAITFKEKLQNET